MVKWFVAENNRDNLLPFVAIQLEFRGEIFSVDWGKDGTGYMI